MQKAKYIKLLTSLVFCSITFFAVYILANDFEDYARLATFDPFLIFLLFVINIFFPIFFGIINYNIFNHEGVRLGFVESIHLASFRSLGNQLPLSAGTFSLGYYLKKKHNFDFTKYIYVLGSYYSLWLFTFGFIGFFSALWCNIYYKVSINPFLYLIYFSMVSVIFILYKIGDLKIVNRFAKLEEFVHHSQSVLRDKRIILNLIFYQIIIALLGAFKIWLCFKFFSYDINFLFCLLFSSVTVTARLFSITPGNIGVSEGIVIGVSELINLDMALTILVLAIDRLTHTLVILFLGIYSSRFLLKNIETKYLEDSEKNLI